MTSYDGTKIGYQVMGRGRKVVVLCNGLGGNYLGWKPLYDRLSENYRCLCWDYRGILTSEPPKDLRHMTMIDHVRDLEAILKKEKVKAPFSVVGWSMGVQLTLEYYRHQAKKISSLILLNGTYGYPFETALNSPLSKYILPKVNELAQKVMQHAQPTLKPLAKKIINWQGFINLVVKLGLVHKNLNTTLFRAVAHSMVSTDLGMYHEIMKHLSQHSAGDVLSKVKVPTLVLAGDADVLTPMKTAEHMVDTIPHAEFFVVAGGTHYSILEFSDLVTLRMEHFLREHDQKKKAKKSSKSR